MKTTIAIFVAILVLIVAPVVGIIVSGGSDGTNTCYDRSSYAC